MMRVALETRSVLRRREMRILFALYALTVFATGVRTYSGAVASGSSIPAIASSDDRTWYIPVGVSVVLGATSCAFHFSTRRHLHAWSNGAAMAGQVAARAAVGMALGAICGSVYWLVRIGSAFASVRFARRQMLLAGPTTLPVETAFALRLVLLCAVVGVVGVMIGVLARRPIPAVAISVVSFAPLLPVLDLLETRVPSIVNVLSFTPGGASTTVLESNAGIATSSGLLNLRYGRPAVVGLAILCVWAASFCAVGLIRRSRGDVVSHSARMRVVKTLVISMSIVAILAAVLPSISRDAFPWYLKPQWLHDVARHASSIDAVTEFIATIHDGRSISPFVDPADLVWQPLRSGRVRIADESQMSQANIVAVHVADLDDSSRSYTYQFELTRSDSGWEVTRVHSSVS